jgi:antitoxin component YwqK of YwqJK toxin-antitoxin module
MKSVLWFCSVFFLSSSFGAEISYDGFINRDGLSYQHNSSKPFTGTSVEYHGNGQLKERTAYRLGKWDGISEGFYQTG